MDTPSFKSVSACPHRITSSPSTLVDGPVVLAKDIANTGQILAGLSMTTPSRRSRSFGGCGTCRDRRLKCDEGRPTCNTCRAAKLTCSGYEKSIFFDFEHSLGSFSGSASGTSRFRRPLLTEDERQRMSEELISSISPSATLWHIARIDEECEKSEYLGNFQINRGPFGAFAVLTVPQKDHKAQTPSWTSTGPARTHSRLEPQLGIGVTDDDEEVLQVPEQLPNVGTYTGTALYFGRKSPLTIQPSHDWLDLSDCWGFEDQVSETSLWNLPSDLGIIQDRTDEETFWDATSTVEAHPLPKVAALASKKTNRPELSNDETLQISPTIDQPVPHDAVFLLNHYSGTVLKGLTPFQHSKTPWHILFIPHVKACLAALTLGEALGPADLTIFFGTLGISASSLGGIRKSAKWLDQAANYKECARHHVRLMLKTAYHIPKAAKYKSMLTALLTMVHVCGVLGTRDQAECYLLETEKLIRVKGLSRRSKSRKVRLLHHCYVFERLLHESMLPGVLIKSSHRQHVRSAIEMSNAKAYSQDSLSFSLLDWGDLGKEIMILKDQEKGENDLHLQIPGVWAASLYPEIFGVSELHMFLLSLIIRLNRSKDDDNHSTTTGIQEFMSRAKSVEKCIHRLKPQHASLCSGMGLEIYDTNRGTSTLEQSMQLGLVIYFYRTVYDVERDILQDKVRDVLECLLGFETTESSKSYGWARLVWPAAVAASEAEDPELRASFTQWFNEWGRRSGLRIFTETLTEVQKRWEDADSRC